jgi:hypothetical protein
MQMILVVQHPSDFDGQVFIQSARITLYADLPAVGYVSSSSLGRALFVEQFPWVFVGCWEGGVFEGHFFSKLDDQQGTFKLKDVFAVPWIPPTTFPSSRSGVFLREDSQSSCRINVLSLNVWDSLERYPRMGIRTVARIIQDSKADVVALQECHSRTLQLITEQLGDPYISCTTSNNPQ